MVKPDTVMEFTGRDVMYETANGAVLNVVLSYENERWKTSSTVKGVSFVVPVFERFREERAVNVEELRFSQVEVFASFEPEEIRFG